MELANVGQYKRSFGELAGKLDEIKVKKDNYGVDIIAITETWCTSSIPDGSLSPSKYT